MSGLHLIQPMGGSGTRYGNEGYQCPKPMIQLRGKPFLYWSIRSVLKDIDVTDIICIVLKEHVESFQIDEMIHRYYPGARIKVIDHVLCGAVLTCAEGLTLVDDDLPVLFNDCDHAFSCMEFADCIKHGGADFDGGLLTFKSDSPAFSYVQYGDDGKVSGTVEKLVVSKDAICGAYYFKNKDIFMDSMESYLTKCHYEEYFISGVYNEMICNGQSVRVFHLDEHISFGTPAELKAAKEDSRLQGYE